MLDDVKFICKLDTFRFDVRGTLYAGWININCEPYKFTILSAIYEWNRLTGEALYLPKPYPLKIQRVSSSSRLTSSC